MYDVCVGRIVLRDRKCMCPTLISTCFMTIIVPTKFQLHCSYSVTLQQIIGYNVPVPIYNLFHRIMLLILKNKGIFWFIVPTKNKYVHIMQPFTH